VVIGGTKVPPIIVYNMEGNFMIDSLLMAKTICDANIGLLSKKRVSEDLAKILKENDPEFDEAQFVFIATGGSFGKKLGEKFPS